MSLDEMAKKFSKKWGVSVEEAKETIKKIQNKKANEDEEKPATAKPGVVPGLENLFPEPLGEISRKVMDINQAAVSTAMTRRLLRAPPDDIEDLRGKVGSLYELVGNWKTSVENQIEGLTKILDEKAREETRAALFKELDTKIDPLRKDLENITAKLGGKPGEGAKEPGDFFDEATAVTEKAKGLLEKAGFKVISGQVSKEEVQKMIEEERTKTLEAIPIEKVKEMAERAGYEVKAVKLTREQVQKMIEDESKKVLETTSPEEFKKRLESRGYKVEGGPLTYTEIEERLKKARQEGQESVLDDKRIDAVKEIVLESIKQGFELFAPAINYMFNTMVEARGGGVPPSPASKGSQASQEKPA